MHIFPSLFIIATATAVLGTVIDRPNRPLKRACPNKAIDAHVKGTMSHHMHQHSSAVAVVPSNAADTAVATTNLPSATAKPVDPAVSSSVNLGDNVVVPGATSVAVTPATNMPTVAATTSSVTDPKPSTGLTKKAGLGINMSSGKHLQDFVDIPGSQVSWTYNWDSSPSGNEPTGVEYVPQFKNQAGLSNFQANAAKWEAMGVKNLLSLNEPDYKTDLITTAQGAALHQQAFTAALSAKYQIGSPAVARGGKQWLTDWVTACDGKCIYDFVAVHFYGTNADDFITYVDDFITTFGKPVWVTEYGCHDFDTNLICTVEEATAFQKKVVHYMDQNAKVLKHAPLGLFPDFATSGDGNALIDKDGMINELGKVYATTV